MHTSSCLISKVTETLVSLFIVPSSFFVSVVNFILITTTVFAFVADILLSSNLHVLPLNSILLHLLWAYYDRFFAFGNETFVRSE